MQAKCFYPLPMLPQTDGVIVIDLLSAFGIRIAPIIANALNFVALGKMVCAPGLPCFGAPRFGTCFAIIGPAAAASGRIRSASLARYLITEFRQAALGALAVVFAQLEYATAFAAAVFRRTMPPFLELFPANHTRNQH